MCCYITGDHWRDGYSNYPKIMIIFFGYWTGIIIYNYQWWLVVWLIISTNFRLVNWWTIKQHVHCCGSKLSKFPKNQMDLSRILPCPVSRCNVTQPQTSASSLRNSHKNPCVQLATSIFYVCPAWLDFSRFKYLQFQKPRSEQIQYKPRVSQTVRIEVYSGMKGEGIDDM